MLEHVAKLRYVCNPCDRDPPTGSFKKFNREGKSAINLSNFREFLPNLTPGHLFMLGRSAVPKIIYVRTAVGPENTSNIGENPNINNLT